VNGPRHYQEAERLLDQAYRFAYGDASGSVEAHTCATALAVMAQTHATLAHTAATVDGAFGMRASMSSDQWRAVFDPPVVAPVEEIEDVEYDGPECDCDYRNDPWKAPEQHARSCPVFAMSGLPVGGE
jgi:hypothetical protein